MTELVNLPPQTYIQLAKRLHDDCLFNMTCYWVNHNYKIIYCNIPKNANTLFLNMMMDISGESEHYQQQSEFNVHQYMLRNRKTFGLIDLSLLRSSEYFKFVILRNPFKRILSAYLDKLVKSPRAIPKHKPLVGVIENVYDSLGQEVDIDKGITFSQFIHYLVRTENINLDVHWRPQYTFLGQDLFEFDFLGQFENIELTIIKIREKFGIEIRENVTNPKHRTSYAQIGLNGETHFSEQYPAQLRFLQAFPSSSQFYTPELVELVKRKYAEDIKIYENEFSTSLNELGN